MLGLSELLQLVKVLEVINRRRCIDGPTPRCARSTVAIIGGCIYWYGKTVALAYAWRGFGGFGLGMATDTIKPHFSTPT